MKNLAWSISDALCAFTAALILIVSLTPNPGYAQQLDEITVTARKTSERLQDVPMAVTAIGAEEIDRLGIKDLTKINQQDTSIQFDEGFTPSDTRLTIRGLSPTRGRPNAATLIDGIDVTSEAVSNAGGSLLINPRLLDVERIEIIKGPQSALYGRSAFAGALQYVTKDPADTLSGGMNVEANSEDAQEVRGNLSVPLTDSLGMLVNGAYWNQRGSYRNQATGDYVGDGDGIGTSLTFKWEPTETLNFKFRTEYSDDHFGPTPQALLHEQNKLYDLGASGQLDAIMGANNPLNGGSNLAPGSATCPPPGSDDNYFSLNSYACGSGLNLSQWFNNPANADKVGQFNAADARSFNQYNKQVVSIYTGKIPDAKHLKVNLMPNYSYGKGATNPNAAEDYDGVDKEVFRTSLVAEWALRDNLTLNSYSSYLASSVLERLDLSKHYVDKCSPDIAAISAPGTDPLGGGGSYADAMIANGIPQSNLAQFAPCNPALGADGVHDGPVGFVQTSNNDTTQFSQEIRVSWDINDDINFSNGLLYWQENVKQDSKSSTTIVGGPECYLGNAGSPTVNDGSQSANGQFFTQTDPFQDQCGSTQLSVAYWMAETYQGRVQQPDTTRRDTNHWSWYGLLDVNFTEKFSTRLEARFTREKNTVRGLEQNPCINSNLRLGELGCDPHPLNFNSRKEVFANGTPLGPGAATICGSNGRCDRVGLAPQSGSPYYALTAAAQGTYSWSPWGYLPETGYQKELSKIDRFWAPKLTIEYRFNDDIMGYASWARGIKPGGYSLLTTGAFGLDANLDGNYDEIDYDPERLDVWETGLKSTLFDGRVRLNGSVFYQDFKDKQVTVQAIVGTTVGNKVENISGSEIYGLEFDGSWQVTDNLRASLGYTYLESEYTDYTLVTTAANDIARVALGPNGANCSEKKDATASDPVNGCIMSLNGNELERAPKNAVLVNLNYTNNLFDTGYEWYGETSWRYQDARYVEFWNIAEFQAYDITDVRLGMLADSWDVIFFVDNLFDDDTVTTGGPNPGIATASFGFGLAPGGTAPFPGVNAGPKLPRDIYAQMPNPRTAGVRFSARFGE